MRVIVCVDACDGASDVVFRAGASLVESKAAEHMTVFHAFREHKAGDVARPVERLPRTIALHFEAACVSRFPKKRFEIITAELPSEMPTRRGIMEVVSSLEADLVVLGFTGRKGAKEDVSIMGSSTDLSLREGRTSALVVKRGGPYETVVVGVDGSPRSLDALRLALRVAPLATTVTAICVNEVGLAAGEHIAQLVAGVFAAAPATASAARVCTFKALDKRADENSGSTLSRVAADMDAQLVLIGADGCGAAKRRIEADVAPTLGSVSDAVIRSTRCDVLLVHPARSEKPDETGMERAARLGVDEDDGRAGGGRGAADE